MDFYRLALASHPAFPAIDARHKLDEQAAVASLIEAATLPAETAARVQRRARALVLAVRSAGAGGAGIDAFMHEYALSSQEGVVLMCLAEALLRIPDDATVDRLIEDKIGAADWHRHLGHSASRFVNASTWGLMITGRLLEVEDSEAVFQRLLRRSGEPLVRAAMRQAMRILGRQFVMGRTIEEALERAAPAAARGYRHSYDMLGEAACTARDAERYQAAYASAIDAIGAAASGRGPEDAPEISVKLSALHPRLELTQGARVVAELVPRLKALALRAKGHAIGLTVDAEEADRLALSLEVFERVLRDPALAGWTGFGIAVQAYQKRALAVIDWLLDLARAHGRRLPVRLVKGAYWDTEIKRAQERGLDTYPVFTRKACTDVSYLACARKLLAHRERVFPQFATHNAHAVAAVLEMAGGRGGFELQRLHGMGEALHDQVVAGEGVPCRVYAPVGGHEELLPYLVRRLLENGSNTSFVNRLVDARAPVDDIVADPVARVAGYARAAHPRIPLPAELYAPQRRNARGVDLGDPPALERLARDMGAADAGEWTAAPLIGGAAADGPARALCSPADRARRIGTVVEATPAQAAHAVARARDAAVSWDATPAAERAACLERAADLMERDLPALVALCAREAGKTVADGIAEVREAVDFCRYYAALARADFAAPQPLPGPAGERNALALHGRGVFACISPWNFPLAIFTGQAAAALAAGNAVVAKPAEQTPLIACHAVRILHRAGVPGDVLHCLPGGGATVGAALARDPRVAGVAFTGSTETAWAINRALAARSGPIAALIAETGGQNALIVDSSALPEQVVADALASAFRSAGQRCSALRVLFAQAEIADRLVEMLAGAMDELRVGDPWELATDVGPVIDAEALAALDAHAARLQRSARPIRRCTLPPGAARGSFFAPRLFEIDGIQDLEHEVFGPCLHVVRYRARDLDRVVDAINATGYGLTFGIHSRIDGTVRRVTERIRAGNLYVNRNLIGAVVGVQPFGGEGLSGTGPKAGGPRYLHRFATERTLSVNTAAAGGDTALLSLQDDP